MFTIENKGNYREFVTTIVRADNLLYFAVCRFVRNFRVCNKKKKSTWVDSRVSCGEKTRVSRKSGFVQTCSLGTPFGLSAHGDLLLRRNLLVFCPYILVLKWKKIVEMPLCLSHIFFLRERKRRTREKAKVESNKRVSDISSHIQATDENQEEKRFSECTRVFFFL